MTTAFSIHLAAGIGGGGEPRKSQFDMKILGRLYYDRVVTPIQFGSRQGDRGMGQGKGGRTPYMQNSTVYISSSAGESSVLRVRQSVTQ